MIERVSSSSGLAGIRVSISVILPSDLRSTCSEKWARLSEFAWKRLFGSKLGTFAPHLGHGVLSDTHVTRYPLLRDLSNIQKTPEIAPPKWMPNSRCAVSRWIGGTLQHLSTSRRARLIDCTAVVLLASVSVPLALAKATVQALDCVGDVGRFLKRHRNPNRRPPEPSRTPA